MFALLVGEPRTPFRQRGADAAVVELLALGGYAEDIGHEHLGQRLLVVDYVFCSVGPGDAGVDGRLGLHNHHRDAVDEQHHIEPLSSGIRALGVFPLVGHHIAVVLLVRLGIGVEEVYRHIFALLAKRKTVLVEEELAQVLVGCYDVAAHAAGDAGFHLLHHYLCLLVADLVDSLQGLQQQLVHDDRRLILAQGVGLAIGVARFLRYAYAHLLSYVVFVEVCHSGLSLFLIYKRIYKRI